MGVGHANPGAIVAVAAGVYFRTSEHASIGARGARQPLRLDEADMPRPSLSSLNLLRVFEVAGRVGSFKLAGIELHVTASAVVCATAK